MGAGVLRSLFLAVAAGQLHSLARRFSFRRRQSSTNVCAHQPGQCAIHQLIVDGVVRIHCWFIQQIIRINILRQRCRWAACVNELVAKALQQVRTSTLKVMSKTGRSWPCSLASKGRGSEWAAEKLRGSVPHTYQRRALRQVE